MCTIDKIFYRTRVQRAVAASCDALMDSFISVLDFYLPCFKVQTHVFRGMMWNPEDTTAALLY